LTTSPFAAGHVVFAADGTLWALGRVHSANYDDEPEYDCLRHYDTTGKLIGSALPRSSFAPGRIGPASESLLTASADRIGVVSLTSQEYAEISPTTGEVLGHWKVPNLSRKSTGAALLKGNELYISGQRYVDKRVAAATLSHFNKTTGALEEVDAQKLYGDREKWFYIMGAEENHLVLRMGPSGVMAWVGVAGGSE